MQFWDLVPKQMTIFRPCPNLKKIRVCDNSFITEDKNILTKLETISCINSMVDENFMDKMKMFTDKYSKTMINIEIILDDETYLTTEDINKCLIMLSQFENLQLLNLTINDKASKQKTIDQSLEQLTRNCVKLKKFQLYIADDSLINDKLFTALSHLKAIIKAINTVMQYLQ